MKFWRKLDRIAAWSLLVGMVVYFVSGYGMTKGIINSEFAAQIHTNYLPIAIAVALIIHAGFATRLALIRWKVWRWPAQVAWVSFLVIFFFAAVFLDRVYRMPTNVKNLSVVEVLPETPAPASSPAPSPSVNQTLEQSTPQPAVSQLPNENETAQRTFTQEELAGYDGANGNPAYVAVNGMVYDLTSVFRNGRHFSHLAGQELTNDFSSTHNPRSISRYPVVGIYLG